MKWTKRLMGGTQKNSEMERKQKHQDRWSTTPGGRRGKNQSLCISLCISEDFLMLIKAWPSVSSLRHYPSIHRHFNFPYIVFNVQLRWTVHTRATAGVHNKLHIHIFRLIQKLERVTSLKIKARFKKKEKCHNLNVMNWCGIIQSFFSHTGIHSHTLRLYMIRKRHFMNDKSVICFVRIAMLALTVAARTQSWI